MRKRAEQVDETRQRIVEAAVRLHGTVGPAATTIAGIAAEAGVTRLTVYRHFADDEALYAACSARWLSRQQLPEPDRWLRVANPADRLRAGLADLYRFYRQGEGMLTRLYRDKAALPETVRAGIETDDLNYREVMLEPFAATGERRRRLRAVIGHSAAFATWRSLCIDNDLSDREAITAMTTLVHTIAEP
jgi:AcrR family transcriptional regulator